MDFETTGWQLQNVFKINQQVMKMNKNNSPKIGIFDYMIPPKDSLIARTETDYFRQLLQFEKTLEDSGYYVKHVPISPFLSGMTSKILEKNSDEFDIFLVHAGIFMNEVPQFAKKYQAKKVAILVQDARLEPSHQRRELPFLSYGIGDPKEVIDFIEGRLKIEQEP